jgi:hypothetical protein
MAANHPKAAVPAPIGRAKSGLAGPDPIADVRENGHVPSEGDARMMPSDYVMLDGKSGTLDLDAVYDVVGGESGKRDGWSALIVFDPASGNFVELRSSPPDVRGGSADEAEAVPELYVTDQFGLPADALARVRSQPAAWNFKDYRTRPNGS